MNLSALLPDGQDDTEACTLARGAFHFDPAMVALYDLGTDGQPETRAFKLRAPVQALERLKDPFYMIQIQSDPVILDVHSYTGWQMMRQSFRADKHLRWNTGPVELQRVSNQVLKKVLNLD